MAILARLVAFAATSCVGAPEQAAVPMPWFLLLTILPVAPVFRWH